MLLLDTCTLLWIAGDRSKLSQHVLTRLSIGGAEAPVVSAISAFEVAVKWRKGKLQLPMDPDKWFQTVTSTYGCLVEPITSDDALCAALLPPHHNDPADRIIIATAIRLNASVVTPDPLFAQYTQVQTVW